MKIKSVVQRFVALCAVILYLLFGNVVLSDITVSELSDMGLTAAALEDHEKVVTSFSGLKDALTGNNGITTVYLGADITMQLGGININNNKTNVEIVGLNPLTPERTEPYTLTDYSSSTFTDTIYINSAGVKSVLMRDIKIIGKNFFGPISALDTVVTNGLTFTFQRVVYTGPQIGFNRRSSIWFKDCDIKITGENGGSDNQEVSEAKHLYFEGTNTVSSQSSIFSIFWLPGGGTFTLLDDSSLTVTSPNTSTAYGVFFAGSSLNDIVITLSPSSVFSLTISSAFAPVLYSTVTGMTIQKDAHFILNTTQSASSTVFSIGGNLTIEENASFTLNGFGGTFHSALEIKGGNITVEKNAVFHIIALNSYTDLVDLNGRAFILNDPASVLLYNIDSRAIVATATAGRIYGNAEQINLWNAAGTGGFDDTPLYSWRKADQSNIVIDAVLAAGVSGNITSISSNHAPGDLPETPPTTTSFDMRAARVLSFGRLALTVDIHFAAASAITGSTAPGAAVMSEFTQNDEDYISPNVLSDTMGRFEIPIGVSIIKDTVVTVRSAYRHLFATEVISVISEGTLEISIPEVLTFTPVKISNSTQLIKRHNDNWHIYVWDTRDGDNVWSLYARLLQPLTPTDENKPVLENAIVFVDESGIPRPMSDRSETLIYEHFATSADGQIRIGWDADRGILAEMPSTTIYSNIPYTAIIEWSLIEAP